MNLSVRIPERPPHLRVALVRVALRRAASCFCTCAFEPVFPTGSARGTQKRTEVVRDSAAPHFRDNTFAFKLHASMLAAAVRGDPMLQATPPPTLGEADRAAATHSPSGRESPGTLRNPTLVIEGYEVAVGAGGADDGRISLVGTALIHLEDVFATLVATGERHTFSCTLEAPPADPLSIEEAAEGGEDAGTVVVEVQVTEERWGASGAGGTFEGGGGGGGGGAAAIATAAAAAAAAMAAAAGLEDSSRLALDALAGGVGSGAASAAGGGALHSPLAFRRLVKHPDLRETASRADLDVPDTFHCTVMVHCGVNLPMVAGGLPSPFIACKTTRDAREKRPAKSATSAVPGTRNPIWRELLELDVTKEDVLAEDGLFFAVVDAETQKYLGKCIVPFEDLVFGEQYNLGLILDDAGAYCLLTLEVENFPANVLATFAVQPAARRLAIFVDGFEAPILPRGDEIVAMAVLHLVDDGHAFRENMLRRLDSATSELPNMPFVPVDSPAACHTLAPADHKATFPTEETLQPVWKDELVFDIHEDVLAMANAAVVIDYFRFEFPPEHTKTRVRKSAIYSGFSVLLLRDIADVLGNAAADGVFLPIERIPVEFISDVARRCPRAPTVRLEVAWWGAGTLPATGAPVPAPRPASPSSTALREKVAHQQALIERLSRNLRQQQAEAAAVVARATAEIAELRGGKAALEMELAQLDSVRADEAERLALIEQIDDLRRRFKGVYSEKIHAEQRHEELLVRHNEQSIRLAELIEDRDELQAQLEHLRSSCATQQSVIEKLEEVLGALSSGRGKAGRQKHASGATQHVAAEAGGGRAGAAALTAEHFLAGGASAAAAARSSPLLGMTRARAAPTGAAYRTRGVRREDEEDAEDDDDEELSHAGAPPLPRATQLAALTPPSSDPLDLDADLVDELVGELDDDPDGPSGGSGAAGGDDHTAGGGATAGGGGGDAGAPAPAAAAAAAAEGEGGAEGGGVELGGTGVGARHIPALNPEIFKMQPVRHAGTGTMRRPSPRLAPLSPRAGGVATPP